MENQEIDRDRIEIERARLEHERQQSAQEHEIHMREVAISEAEQAHREAELELKKKNQAKSGWRNPLVVAILAATIAASGNMVVALINGILERNIESQKSEDARILKMVKTGDPDKAAENLRFLLEAGLIDNRIRIDKLNAFLSNRDPGTGPALPSGKSTDIKASKTMRKIKISDLNTPLSLSVHFNSLVFASYRVSRTALNEKHLIFEGTNLDAVPDVMDLGQPSDLIGRVIAIEAIFAGTSSSNDSYYAKFSFEQGGETLSNGMIEIAGSLTEEVEIRNFIIFIEAPDDRNGLNKIKS
jgi:hypothetical protein